MGSDSTAIVDLVRRYDLNGPRYTSYPTAPRFHSGFGPAQLREAIQASNGDPIPRRLSLYVHVPYCMSPCFYCGCNRIITRDKTRTAPYLARLSREVETMAGLFDRDREAIQLHFGGGTPNFLTPAQLQETVEMLRGHFRFSGVHDRDISIELDPRFITPQEIARLAHAGFNRASLGVQDFDPHVQAAVNRLQTVEETYAVVEACRDAGMHSINLDLIYGLPMQTAEGFARTLDTVIGMRPDRLAVYSYAHLPEMFKPQKQLNAADLPPGEVKLALLQLAIDKLTDAGYAYIGMDHFALPDDELAMAQQRGGLHRNFMGYTTHADSDLIGLGVSAISHIGNSYSQNPRSLSEWEAAIDAGHMPVWRGLTLSEDDELRSEIIQQFMCAGRLHKPTFARRHGIDFDAYFAAALEQLRRLQRDGLVELAPDSIRATTRGRFLLRIIAMCFDAYLHTDASQDRIRHAKAI